MNNSRSRIVFCSSLVLLGSSVVSCQDDNGHRPHVGVKPNVLLVIVDDFGWGHLAINKDQYSHSEFNSRMIDIARQKGYTPQQALSMAERATPTLNSLAEKGIRFVDAYASSNVSSPSRAGIITAAYQERFGFYNLDDGNVELKESVTTMPELMQQSGYATGSFGKVHYIAQTEQGRDFSFSPTKMGFDTYFGYNFNSCRYFNSEILYKDDDILPISDKYLTDRITDETIEFIDNNIDKPKLMYVAYNAVHEPLGEPAPPEYLNYFPERPFELANFYAYVYAFDQGIRKIMDRLEQLGQLDNTIIIFISDNGAAAPNDSELLRSNSPLPSNGPLQGFKGEAWNGGIKVPMIISWGDRIKKGSVCNSMVSSLDIFPTIIEAAGIQKPLFQPVDGRSMMPIINGNYAYSPHHELVWMIQHGNFFTLDPPTVTSIDEMKPSDAYASFVVRRDQWALKYTLMNDKNELEDTYELYDIRNDKSQRNNLAAQYPELVASMTQSFRNWYRDMADPNGWNNIFWKDMKAKFR